MAEKFEGITLDEEKGTVSHDTGSGPVQGATAMVETPEELERRLPGTGAAMADKGVGRFWRHEVERGELFLSVEGHGFAFVVDVHPKKAEDARRFAAKVNAAASAADH